ncbi:hypothetical protein HDE69_003018 [Pedobacter cryoconitis]|uniref:Uncharacterized protein n=1 Tax=Pedobacter cryoconitis TaxID=188932 RepID=A0A7W9DLA2_9SPHI|nr:hypothetical protein [Pedobacter cryoconitis]
MSKFFQKIERIFLNKKELDRTNSSQNEGFHLLSQSFLQIALIMWLWEIQKFKNITVFKTAR